MTRFTTTLLFVAMFIVLGSCQPKNSCVETLDCLVGLQKRVSARLDWKESDTGLLNDPQFLWLYVSANDRFNDLLDIVQSDVNEHVKVLAVLVAQGINSDRYPEFARMVLDASIRGTASERVVAYCVFPGVNWGTGLVEQVERPDVQEFFKLAEQTASSKILIDVLDGVRDKGYQRYIDDLRGRGIVVPTVLSKIQDLR